jgi:hypothetical protein
MSVTQTPAPSIDRPAPAPSPSGCPNCGQAIVPADAAYCPWCGQELHVNAFTLRDFLQHWGGAYLSTEGALWRSMRLLLLRPGQLTVHYLNGRRKHYVHPLRLYMTLSVLLLLAAGFSSWVQPVTGSTNPALAAAIQATPPTAVINYQGFAVGLRKGQPVCTRLPDTLCSLLQQRIRDEPAEFLVRLRQANSLVVARWGLVMAVLLPAFAACLKLVHFPQSLPFGVHVVYLLHVHAFWACMLFFTLPGWTPLTATAILAMAIYTVMAGKLVYGGRWGPRLVRTAVLSAVYAAMLAVAMPLSFLIALLV